MTILVQKQLREATERLIAEGENCWPATVERFTELANPKAVLALLDELGTANANHENAVAHMQSVCAERDQLKAENAQLRRIVSECATACGAGVSPECSLAFMAGLPREIELAMTKEQP